MNLSTIQKKFSLDHVVYFSAALFVVFFCYLSFGRHEALKSYLNDLGTYDQIIWNSAHGHFFDNSANMLEVRNYLGSHFSPVLLFFIPFYLVAPDPRWLLFFQAAFVAGGAFFIYLFAREKLGKKSLAFVFFFSFLLNPFIQNALLYDFHEAVVAVFFAAGAFYFLEKEKWKCFYVFSAFLSLSQEHLSILVFMMGLYIIFRKKKIKIGTAVAIISASYFLAVISLIMPFFSESGSPAVIASKSVYISRYAWLGSDVLNIAKNILSHPFIILRQILSGDGWRYLVALIVPVFSLAIYSWPVFIILPMIFIYLLSSQPMTYHPFFYHNAVIIPFIYFSAIITFRRWFLDDKYLGATFSVCILVFSFGSFYLYSLAPGAGVSGLSDFAASPHAQKIKEVKKIVPSDAKISIQHNLGPHFSERREIYRFPLKVNEADYIILDRYDPYAGDRQDYFEFDYARQLDDDEWESEVERIRESSGFENIFDDGDYLVYRKISRP